MENEAYQQLRYNHKNSMRYFFLFPDQNKTKFANFKSTIDSMTFETDDALRKLETVEAECERYKKACELKVIFSFIIIRFAQMRYIFIRMVRF